MWQRFGDHSKGEQTGFGWAPHYSFSATNHKTLFRLLRVLAFKVVSCVMRGDGAELARTGLA